MRRLESQHAVTRDPAAAESTHGIGADQASPSARTRNFLTIQALRAIAALLVVLYHFFDMWRFRIDPAAPGVTWINGAAGVDIFFVISGFVMVASSQRLVAQPGAWRTFMRHRIIRIVPLYWLLTTLKLVLVFLFADLALRSSLEPDYIARSYLFFPVVDSAGHFRPLLPVGWTLTYEFVFYVLFALALALRVDVFAVLLPGLGLIILAALFRAASWPDWTILFNTLVLEFIFGVALARAVLRGWTLPPALAACCVAAGFALILSLSEGSESLRTLTWGLPALAIVAGAVSLEARIAPAIPPRLLQLGDSSYAIYLTHGFVVPVLGVAIVWLHWTDTAAEVMTLVACVAAGALAGRAVYVILERPMLRVMKGWTGGSLEQKRK